MSASVSPPEPQAAFGAAPSGRARGSAHSGDTAASATGPPGDGTGPPAFASVLDHHVARTALAEGQKNTGQNSGGRRDGRGQHPANGNPAYAADPALAAILDALAAAGGSLPGAAPAAASLAPGTALATATPAAAQGDPAMIAAAGDQADPNAASHASSAGGPLSVGSAAASSDTAATAETSQHPGIQPPLPAPAGATASATPPAPGTATAPPATAPPATAPPATAPPATAPSATAPAATATSSAPASTLPTDASGASTPPGGQAGPTQPAAVAPQGAGTAAVPSSASAQTGQDASAGSQTPGGGVPQGLPVAAHVTTSTQPSEATATPASSAGPTAASAASPSGPAGPPADASTDPSIPVAAQPMPQASTPAAPASAAAAAPGAGVALAHAIETVRMTIEMAAGRYSQARIELSPPELGDIRIRLHQTADGIVARVVAAHAGAAQLLQQGGSDLRRSLEQAGVPLLRLDIEASGQRGPQARDTNHPGTAPNREGATSTDGLSGPALDESGSTQVQLPNGASVNVLA